MRILTIAVIILFIAVYWLAGMIEDIGNASISNSKAIEQLQHPKQQMNPIENREAI